ncbi:type III secretion protein [Aliishimia ponticola]|uniref:Type III secretion protein n=1 Tax=Aliishimia ponticola TaxID=2499833 RepID=A0A4S4N6M7_9RHOB|nr:flagellar biosynthetic protein FliR [Aliishimia ponticola]THH34794.1 type III secretion protein [Aliishimia ponticola]
MEVITALIPLLEGQATTAFAVFLRMSAFFSLMPGFGERSVPTRVKLILSFAMTMVVLPSVTRIDPSDQTTLLILSEITTGLIFGLALRLFVLALQTAGAIAAQATSLSQLLGGNGSDPMPAIGHILVVAGLALAVMTGLHIKAAQFFIVSYELVPVGTFPNPTLFSEWGIQRAAYAFTLAFSLAAPFVLLSVVYNLAIGAINRAMPQLMVAFVGAPLITAGGLVMLMLAAPLMLTAWIEAMDRFLAAPLSGAP